MQAHANRRNNCLHVYTCYKGSRQTMNSTHNIHLTQTSVGARVCATMFKKHTLDTHDRDTVTHRLDTSDRDTVTRGQTTIGVPNTAMHAKKSRTQPRMHWSGQ